MATAKKATVKKPVAKKPTDQQKELQGLYKQIATKTKSFTSEVVRLQTKVYTLNNKIKSDKDKAKQKK